MASFLGIDLSKETFHAFLLSDRADAKSSSVTRIPIQPKINAS
jgi:hypothetical protein